jgi:3',5'-cyclic AMP phosphodiesterase CpdA
MTWFSWLHLSDTHFRRELTPEQEAIFADMLNDIRARREEEGLDIDAVFFTGDLSFSAQPEEYQLAMQWLDRILQACDLAGQRERLFIVPGNHDVDWGVTRQTERKHLSHASLAADLLNDRTPYRKITEFLSNDAERQWAFEKFGNFARFVSDFFSPNVMRFDHGNYFSVRPIPKGGHTVIVIGLNSAWLCFDEQPPKEGGYAMEEGNRQGQLLLGERQVRDALRQADVLCATPSLSVCLTHHPPYWLAEKDLHRVQRLLSERCRVLLRGHLHCPSCSVQSTPDYYIHEFAAGASLEDADSHYCAYNLAKVDLETMEGTAIGRIHYSELGSGWRPDTFTYGKVENGKFSFSLARPSLATTEA